MLILRVRALMEAMALNRTLGKPMTTEPRANHPKGGYIYCKKESASNKPQAIVVKSGHFFSLLVSPCGLKLASSLAVFNASAETITYIKIKTFRLCLCERKVLKKKDFQADIFHFIISDIVGTENNILKYNTYFSECKGHITLVKR